MHLLKDHVYKQQEVVVGGNLNAFVYAYKKGCYIIPNTLDRPFAYDPSRLDSNLGLEGFNDEEAWEFMSYSLNQKGLNPMGNLIKKIYVDGDQKVLKINTGRPNLVKVKFEKLRVFDTTNVEGLSLDYDEEIVGYRVFDWFDVRSGTKHDINEIIDDENDFVKKIHFYLSERIDGNHDKKDLISESFLSKEQIHDIDYSDSISRLKTISMMKDAGIRGKRNGPGKYLSIKIDLWKREIKQVKNLKSFEKGDIIFDGRSCEEILNEFSSCRNNTISRPSA
tara:strand:+ start:8351 stop:9187 length:837 start_codon:yes stop_codon:yes gene_type:complete